MSFVPMIRLGSPYLYRQIFTKGYVMGGYKDGSPWNTVNKATYSTETMTNQGNIMTLPGSYTDGQCSPTRSYIWSLTNTHSSPTVTSNWMAHSNDTTCTADSSMDMKVARHDFVAPSYPDRYALLTGGTTSTCDRFDYWTEVMTATGDSGFSTNYGANVYSEDTGWVMAEGTGRKVLMPTETWSAYSMGISIPVHTKGLSSKVGYGFWIGHHTTTPGEGRYIDRLTYANDTNTIHWSDQHASAGEFGQTETNNAVGQEKGYILGGYNHGTNGQNNLSQTLVYSTGTCSYVSGLNLIGHNGASSGAGTQGGGA